MTVEEVKELRDQIYADGKVDLEEVKALFAKKEELDNMDDVDEEAYAEFIDLLTDAVCDWSLEDGVFEESEAQVIIDCIMKDDTIDDYEEDLINDLIARCEDQEIELPANFVEAFGEFIPEDEEDDE